MTCGAAPQLVGLGDDANTSPPNTARTRCPNNGSVFTTQFTPTTATAGPSHPLTTDRAYANASP